MSENREVIVYSKEKEHFELAQRQAQAFATSTLVPESMRDRSNCLAAIMMADEMGESRLAVLQNIFFIHGRPGWITSFIVSRANRSGKLIGPVRWRTTARDPLTVECYATLKEAPKEDARIALAIDLRTAEESGWTTYKKGNETLTHARWATPVMQEQMLRWRSASWLLRLYLPETMMGLPTKEELEDSDREMVDVTPLPPMPKLDDFAEPKAAQPASGPIPTSPEPPEQTPVPVAPPGEPRRRRVPRKPVPAEAVHGILKESEPTEAEIEPSTVEPPVLDPAPIEPPPEYEPEDDLPPASVYVPFEASGNPQEWFARARTRLRQMSHAEAPPDRYAAFRKANFAPLLRLNKEFHSYWQQIDGLIKMGEQ